MSALIIPPARHCICCRATKRTPLLTEASLKPSEMMSFHIWWERANRSCDWLHPHLLSLPVVSVCGGGTVRSSVHHPKLLTCSETSRKGSSFVSIPAKIQLRWCGRTLKGKCIAHLCTQTLSGSFVHNSPFRNISFDLTLFVENFPFQKLNASFEYAARPIKGLIDEPRPTVSISMLTVFIIVSLSEGGATSQVQAFSAKPKLEYLKMNKMTTVWQRPQDKCFYSQPTSN